MIAAVAAIGLPPGGWACRGERAGVTLRATIGGDDWLWIEGTGASLGTAGGEPAGMASVIAVVIGGDGIMRCRS